MLNTISFGGKQRQTLLRYSRAATFLKTTTTVDRIPRTSVALGVLAVSVEDQIPNLDPNLCAETGPLWSPGGLPWPPVV